jgi:predicted nucleic acid-binding protein
MLFDTDIIIWMQRGNKKAADLIDNHEERFISIMSYMELMQCAPNNQRIRYIKDLLTDFGFTVLPLNQNIGHTALLFVEQYSLTSGIQAVDAVIAATAMEHNSTLATSNCKHFKSIKNLKLKTFRP